MFNIYIVENNNNNFEYVIPAIKLNYASHL